MIVERREKCDPEAAVRHCVQQAVAGRSQKEICPKGKMVEARRGFSKSQGYDRASQQSREHKRMRESSVPPKIAIADAKSESNDINVGNDGTKHTNRPNAPRSDGAVEARAYAESRHCV